MFGHEKGAFTGATAQRIGRLELADKGTLFLDEVGDIPSELQPKLLRAIQEQEFERLGSTRSIHVDVRLISATNRNLEEMVANREFRSDLYYRLNVFPLYIPPLRERKGDIPLLVHHFAKKFTARLNKEITTIPSETMRVLESMPEPRQCARGPAWRIAQGAFACCACWACGRAAGGSAEAQGRECRR
jgi:formate hydrogenlyase transcriptional activator